VIRAVQKRKRWIRSHVVNGFLAGKLLGYVSSIEVKRGAAASVALAGKVSGCLAVKPQQVVLG
jgi:hypothetical protein